MNVRVEPNLATRERNLPFDVVALVLHEMTFDPLGPTKIPLAVLALAACIVFWPQIVTIIALDDPDRGTGSGFTGRDDLWQLALEQIIDSPFGVGFKRAAPTRRRGPLRNDVYTESGCPVALRANSFRNTARSCARGITFSMPAIAVKPEAVPAVKFTLKPAVDPV